MSLWVFETARSNRSKCKLCKRGIELGELRIGCIDISAYKTTRWYHISCCPLGLYTTPISKVKGIEKVDNNSLRQLLKFKPSPSPVHTLSGKLSLEQLGSALCHKHGKFRSFQFGLPSEQKYTQNWNWRCFLATMLVCNTRERDMLTVAADLFSKYKEPRELREIEDNESLKAELVNFWKRNNLRHAERKLRDILAANSLIIDDHKGIIPNNRKTLQSFRGVGRHVASVSLAWIYEEPEFGIDVHVKRILKRWGVYPKNKGEIAVETEVKKAIDSKKIGHFSRALVDHGQDVCGYTPECHRCFLRYSCPSAGKDLSW